MNEKTETRMKDERPGLRCQQKPEHTELYNHVRDFTCIPKLVKYNFS